jgi:transcriptional regulator with XRE-family HTH domain
MIESVARDILNRLAEAVASNAVTQQTISEATGVHQSQISRILSGKVRRVSKNVLRLCNFYNLHMLGRVPAPLADAGGNIQDSFHSLVTGKKEADIALRQVIDSLAKWRNCLENFRG